MIDEKLLKEYLNKYENGQISTSDLHKKLSEFDLSHKTKSLLSEGQKGIWAIQKLNQESTAYNIPICFEFQKKVNLDIFRQAVEYVWEKYPILKSTVVEENDKLYLVFVTSMPLSYDVVYISDMNDEELLNYVKKLANIPFSLDKGPLFRVQVLVGKSKRLVLINMHHIICDGTSSVILTKALLNAYNQLTENKEINFIEAKTSYSDFVDWEKAMLSGKTGENHKNFWKEQLRGELPITKIISDLAVNQNEIKANVFQVSISKEIKENIEAFSKKQRIGLPSFFLAVLNIFLYQCTNQNDLIVGTACMGRPEERFEPLVGYFINMIPVRSQIDGTKPFSNYVENLQLLMFECLEHADYPYTSIVKDRNKERKGSNTPIFEVAYYYQNFLQSDFISSLKKYEDMFGIKFLSSIHQEGEYDFVLEVLEQEEEILLSIKYNEAIYSKELIEHYANNICSLSENFANNPSLEIQKYPLISKEEERKILFGWNNTDINYSNKKMVHELFEEQTNQNPNKIAVVYENESLTYKQLNEKSEKLAVYLQSIGVEPDTLVGICVERSLDMIVGLLAILKAGGAYVPLDPEYPDERVQYMIDNSNINIILTQSYIQQQKNYLKADSIRAVLVDKELGNLYVPKKLERKAGMKNLAYVLYTSGSTGKPKGVMIPHEALTNFLLQMADKPGLESNDTLLAVTTFCFDIAGLELYLPLIKGAKYYICSSEKKRDIQKLEKEIHRIKPTIMQATPATWMALYIVGWRNEEHVKILCGGEALPEKLKKYFMDSHSEVWNMFGPTETTIWSTMKRVEEEGEITIGKPMANTQVYILNKNNMPVPIGVPGELYISGTGLARGYYNREDLTKERFVDNPFVPGTKMYKTEDIAKWTPSGEINFIGRADNQVKINGFRIELSEIETRMNEYDEIEQSAVIVSERDGNKQLKAFFVGKNKESGRKLDIKQLRSYLKSFLPIYMVPRVFVQIDKLPLTPNGKINRLELGNYKEIDKVSANEKEEVSHKKIDLNQIQTTLLEIWKEFIGNDEIDISDGFFEAGGDSILAVLILEKIKKQYRVDIKVTHLFEYSNIMNLSEYIAEEMNKERTAGSVINNTDASIDIESEKSDLDEYKNCVAIIGISCQFPSAKNADDFWDNLINKRECVERLSREQMLEMNVPKELIDNPKYVPIRLSIEGKELFDNEFFNISPKDAENMNPQMRLLLQNTWKAVEDAGYKLKSISNTGVYMSTSNNSYMSSGGMIDSSESYVKWLMNQEGTIPTMISYRLGLIGPSLAVHSNCSSGLVGLSMAYQSIQLGEIDSALVGASTIHGKDNAGYLYVSGMNFSKNGHICAFDAKADGMIGGEGVAVIMLKNAKKAIQDHDHIYAMLRGISVSNDGTEKVGFYAPSIKGQAYTIEKTLMKTGINPETISYIETHGTGTKLGDPIEFKALKKVYEKYTNKKHFCGIGSVKTNIGHLDTVAGLAGCIKLALGLKNKKIPATVNYSQANPDIDFEDSPFFMTQEAIELDQFKTPSRVSLSSFGIGGTNVHAILEEYTEGEEKDIYAHSECIVPVSAKDEERLKEYIQNILDFFETEQGMKLELCDIAYTMQTGREDMPNRMVFCAKSVTELKEKMNLYIKQGYKTEDYATDEVIRKMQELWMKGDTVNWEDLYRERTKPKKVSLPTYPFAKRKFWHEEKDRDNFFIERNPNDINKVHYLLDSNTSTFMQQKYTTRLTGDEFYLKDHIINDKEVLPGVIYIEMARAAGQDAIKQKISKIKNVVWPRPIMVEQPCNVHVILDNTGENQISFNVVTIENNIEVVHSQGKLFYQDIAEMGLEEQAQNHYFEVESYRGKCDGHVTGDEFYNSSLSAVYQYGVTFQPIKDLFFNEEQSLCYLEVPNERYSEFDEFEIHPSILEGCLQSITGLLYRGDRSPFMPYAIEEIDIYKRFTKKCIAYATYSDNQTNDHHLKKFNIRLFDMDGRILAFIRNYTIRKIPSDSQSTVGVKNGLDMQMYHYEWKKKDKQKHRNHLSKVDSMLIFDVDEKLTNECGYTNNITLITPGNTFREYGKGRYEIIPDKEECYQQLFQELREREQLPNRIIYRWTNTDSDEVNMRTGLYAILYISRALIKLNIREKIKLLYLYQDENNYETVINDSISGFTRTLRIERPNLVFQTIKIKDYQNSIKDLVFSELFENDFDEVYFQKGEKYVKQLVKNDINYPEEEVPFKERGTYLITGGAGKLGILTARYLASKFKANIILAGRSLLDEKKKQNLEELKTLGASDAVYICTDLSKRSDVVRMREQIENKFIYIQGIICCQGVIQDSLIANKTMNQMEEVLRTKIDSTILLDEVMKDVKLDFFLLFSSVSHLGNMGQADYAVANSFLNHFSEYRQKMCEEHKRQGKTVSINWPIWEHGGMHIENSVLEKQKEKTGVYALPDQIGLKAIQVSLMQAYDNVVVLYGEKSRIGDFVSGLNVRDENLIETKVKGDHREQRDFAESVLTFLKETAGELIKVPNFDVNKELDNYGFDSISNTEFANKINEYYGLDIMPTVFFELDQPTVSSLRDYLLNNFYSRLSSFYGESIEVTDVLASRVKNMEKHPVQSPTPDESILNEVTEYLVKAIGNLQKIGNVDMDKDMNSYGFDSISNTELCNLINEHYQIELMPTIFFELDEFTVRGIGKYICANYGKELSGFYGNIETSVSLQNEKRIVQSSKETHPSLDYEKREAVQNLTSYYPVENSVEDTVAIIGMDGVFPQSENLNEFWDKLEQGDSLITEIPTDRFNWQEFEDPCMKWGAFMKNVNLFDADFFGMSKQEAEVLDPQHRMFMQVTWNTIQNAGYRPSSLAGTDTGIFVGIGTQDYIQIVEENLTEYNPYALTGRSPFMMPNRISSLLNIHGPSEAIDTACSSSLVAIHKAAEAVKMGTCKMAIAGGVNLILSPLVHQAFSSASMLSKNGKCNVFDKDANGTVRGEGVGAILLKRLSDAKKDGDHIYAIIRSSGENHKGKSASLTAPNALAEKELIKSVYEKESIDPSTVTYIEVHSTGTKLGDPVEIVGLKNAFAELSQKYGVDLKSQSCAISSVKPIIGHLEAAAGIASVIKVLLSLKHKKILKVLNFKELNPYISLANSPFYINQTNCSWERVSYDIPRRAGVSAFGFGGVNAHLLIEEYFEDTKEESYPLTQDIIEKCIVLSGKNKAAIDMQAEQILEAVEQNNYTNDDLVNIAYTLQTGREEYEERVGFSVKTIDELKKKLQIILSQKKIHDSNVFYGKVIDNSNLLSVLDKNKMLDATIEPLILSGQSGKLLELWVNGVFIDWKRIYKNSNVKKVSLPAYPFVGKPYWVELKKEKKQITAPKILDEDKVRIENVANDLAASAVMSVLSQMLGIEAGKIDLNSTASELGVDSIILMQILRKVQIINPDVDFEVLYQCETILDIINTVSLDKDEKPGYKKEIMNHESDANKKEANNISKALAMVYGTAAKGDEHSILEKYPELIKMNHCNEGRPVFWLHGGFGGVEIYRLMASEFERPFYGIQAKGYMTNEETIEGIEEMAAYYVEIIESVQPSGPYDLGGLSMGGILAYEVCRQLQLKAQKVNSIVMLESIYVDEMMRTEWSNMSTVNLLKDQMFRAGNLLLAFSSDTELKLVTESELKKDVTDKEFLEHLISILQNHGMKKSSEQLKKLIVSFQRILNVLDASTTYYEAKNLTSPEETQCYYFCNPQGSLFGKDEEYFRLVDKGRSYNFSYFAQMWKERMPKLEMITINSSNHMTILTESDSRQKIVELCSNLYTNEKR